RAGYLSPYDSWAHRIAIQRFVDDIPLGPRHPSYSTLVDIERGLPSLSDLRIALVWGMRDWCFTPDFLDRFREFFPAAEVHRMDDAGHWVMEDAYERVIPIIEEFAARPI
ncbi:MAG TPA: alpha/beta fold hydrolase, partial [Pirellulales bacterium]|nr:alpha/beta fold hydrolase [Pirellulales bacterium]